MSLSLFASLKIGPALAKVAAASLDDAAVQSARADTKALGISLMMRQWLHAISWTSLPNELPIVGQVALGSLKDKSSYLLPGSLALSWRSA